MQVDADLYGAGKRRVVTVGSARCAPDDSISVIRHQQPVGADLENFSNQPVRLSTVTGFVSKVA